MQRRSKIIFFLLFLFAIVCFGLVGLYAYMFERYQKDYIEKIQAEVIEVIKSCPYDWRNAVFVCIDGLRYSEAFGAEDEYIPHIWNKLRPLGTIYTNAWIETISLTTSVHSTWLSGYDQFLSNRGYIHPTMPTFIELYRDTRRTWFEREFGDLPKSSGYFPLSKETKAEVQSLLDGAMSFPLEKTYCIVGKHRILDAVDYSSHPAYGEEFASSAHRSMPDGEVYNVFEAKLGHDKPKILFINLADVDEEGHSADWKRYTRAIREADEIVWQMWSYIQSIPAFKNKTDFFIMADHGRHDDAHGGFAHHGDRCEGCLHVPLLMIGPDFKAGEVIDEYASEHDIQPTIGRILGIETPFSKGRVLEEAMVAPGSFPQPIETERIKKLKAEMKKLEADSVGEWYKWAEVNADVEKVGEIDDFALMIYLLGLAECVIERGEDPNLLGGFLNANPHTPGFIIPAIKAAGIIGDASLSIAAKNAAMDVYRKLSPGSTDSLSLREVALYAPTLCRAGIRFDERSWVKLGVKILFDRMVALEGDEALKGDTNEFISRFDYLFGDNSMYKRELTPREKALFFVACGLSLEGIEDGFDERDLYFLKRHLRLQMAFAAPDCGEMCLYAGENDISYSAKDIGTNFLYDVVIAKQTPWEKEEFITLGYGPEINQTGIDDFPSDHYFYILNLANAFLNSGTNYDKIRITIDWDEIFDQAGDDKSEAVTALGAALLAGVRWDDVDSEQYSFNLFPKEWVD